MRRAVEAMAQIFPIQRVVDIGNEFRIPGANAQGREPLLYWAFKELCEIGI